MIKAIRLATDARLEENNAPALNNPAVAHCVEIWKTTHQESLATGRTDSKAGLDAANAYCAAMPPLTGPENISDFIACVGYALAIEILYAPRADMLLNAARIAHSALPKAPKEPKKQPSAA